MRKRNLLLTTLVLCGPLLCASSCNSEPVLSSVSVSEDPVIEDPAAEVAKFEDFSLFYAPERGGYLIGDYKGSLSSLVVPDQATGEDGVTAPIVGLADFAFYGRKGITTVLLGENVNYIGESAFTDTDVTDLRIAGGLTYVGDNAFSKSNVTFYEKDGIEYLPSWDKPYSTAFTDVGTTYSPEGKAHYKLDPSCTHVVIKPGTVSIGQSAFKGCASLLSVAIANSVTSIGMWAFDGCSSLERIGLGKGLELIGSRAFMNCERLSNFTIPSSVTSIGSNVFYECFALTSISIPSSVKSIGSTLFNKCTSLITISVEPDNLVYDSRDNCNAIIETKTNTLKVGCATTVIPDTVTAIGPYAFKGCETLASIAIPSSVTSLGDSSFEYCTSLMSVSLPDSLTSIGSCAFFECPSLPSIVIPNSVTTMGSQAFDYCSSLTIYCHAKSKPVGWDSYWNPKNRPVVWGYRGNI